LPGKHLTDTGYLDAELLVDSQKECGVDLVGPTRPDYRWQAQAREGFAAGDIQVDGEAQRVTCPEGRLSIGWTSAVDRGHNEVIKVKFSTRDCRACPSRGKCTQGKRRTVTLRPREQYEALETARAREGSQEFRRAHAKRAGVAGTISHGVRTCGLRRSRYIGEAKALAAPRDGSRHQCHPDQQLAVGQPPRADKDIGLRPVNGTTDRRLMHLPTVSKVRENPFPTPITIVRGA
jgi:transposase